MLTKEIQLLFISTIAFVQAKVSIVDLRSNTTLELAAFNALSWDTDFTQLDLSPANPMPLISINTVTDDGYNICD